MDCDPSLDLQRSPATERLRTAEESATGGCVTAPARYLLPPPLSAVLKNRPFLTRLLYNFHSHAALDASRSASKRKFHRTQARILKTRLAALQKAPYDWQIHCELARPEAPKPPSPLT